MAVGISDVSDSEFVQYKLHVPTRALSIIVALVFVLAVIGGVFYLIIPPMIDQFEKLGDIVSQYVKQGTNGESFQAVVQQWLHDNRQAIEQVFKRKDVSDAIKSRCRNSSVCSDRRQT